MRLATLYGHAAVLGLKPWGLHADTRIVVACFAGRVAERVSTLVWSGCVRFDADLVGFPYSGFMWVRILVGVGAAV